MVAAAGLTGGVVAKAFAHDHGQPGADAPDEGEELEQGGQGGEEQRHLDHEGAVAAGDAAHVGDEHGGGDDPHHGGHHMLETQGDELTGLGNPLPLKDDVGLAGGLGVHSHYLTKSF